MSAAAARYDARALGEVLDRAVHRTFGRFAVVVPPFVLADALGSLLQFAPLSGPVTSFAFLLAGVVLENRARVVTIVTLGEPARRRTAWGAALRHPGALLFAPIGALDYALPFLAAGLIGGAFVAIVRLRAIFGNGVGVPVPLLIGAAIGLLIGIVLLVALLLLALAAAAATVETVLDRRPPQRSLGRWLGHTFRRRDLLTTLLAAIVFELLVIGVPYFLSVAFPWGPLSVRAALDAVPEGIADAIALLFVWGWRDLILATRQGRDLEAALDAAAVTTS